jgi:hypothetical protein
MRALNEKTQHYYVEGKPAITWGRGSSAVTKKLTAVWLVYTRNPEKGNLPPLDLVTFSHTIQNFNRRL